MWRSFKLRFNEVDMLEKIRKKYFNSTYIELFALCLLVGMTLFAPESFASLHTPIVKKLAKIRASLLAVGKGIVVVSGIACIIMFGMGRPNYKWAALVTGAGAMLCGSSYLITFLTGV